MAVVKGVDLLIFVEDPDAQGSYIVVGGQRGATLSESVETVEVTNKLSNGYKEFEYGFGEWSISADGVYIKNDAAFTALKNAMRNKQKVKVRIKEEGDFTEEGFALVTSRELEGSYDSEATYSLELTGTGPLTPVTAGA